MDFQNVEEIGFWKCFPIYAIDCAVIMNRDKQNPIMTGHSYNDIKV